MFVTFHKRKWTFTKINTFSSRIKRPLFVKGEQFKSWSRELGAICKWGRHMDAARDGEIHGEHPTSALTHPGTFPRTHSLAPSSALPNRAVLQLSGEAALSPVGVTHSWLHRVPTAFAAQRKQKSFHLLQQKHLLAFPSMGTSQNRKLEKLLWSPRGWGWRGQPSWGRNEPPKRQRHAAALASTDGAQPSFQRRTLPMVTPKAAALPVQTASPPCKRCAWGSPAGSDRRTSRSGDAAASPGRGESPDHLHGPQTAQALWVRLSVYTEFSQGSGNLSIKPDCESEKWRANCQVDPFRLDRVKKISGAEHSLGQRCNSSSSNKNHPEETLTATVLKFLLAMRCLIFHTRYFKLHLNILH